MILQDTMKYTDNIQIYFSRLKNIECSYGHTVITRVKETKEICHWQYDGSSNNCPTKKTKDYNGFTAAFHQTFKEHEYQCLSKYSIKIKMRVFSNSFPC